MKRELLATSGDRTLVLIDGVAVIEERGVVVHTEEDGDEFQHYLGVYFGWRIELAMALRANRCPEENGDTGEQPIPRRDEGRDSAAEKAEQDDDDSIPF